MRRSLIIASLCLFVSLPARATIALVQSNSATTSGVTSQTCTLSSTVTAGDLVEVDGVWGNTTGTITASDGTNSLTATGTFPVSGGGNTSFMFYIAQPSTVSSDTITISVSGGGSHRLGVACREFSGTAASPFDKTATGGTNTGVAPNFTITVASLTPSASGELLVCEAETGGVSGGTFSANSPFTLQEAGGTGGAGYLSSGGRVDGAIDTNSTSSSTSCSFGLNSSTGPNGAGIVTAFKPTGAAAAPNTFPVVHR